MKKVEIAIPEITDIPKTVSGNLLYIAGIIKANASLEQIVTDVDAFYSKAWEVFKKATNGFEDNLELIGQLEGVLSLTLTSEEFTAEEKYFGLCLGPEKFQNAVFTARSKISEEACDELNALCQKLSEFNEGRSEETRVAVMDALEAFEQEYGVPAMLVKIYAQSSHSDLDLSIIAGFVSNETTTVEQKEELKAKLLDFCNAENTDMNPLERIMLKRLRKRMFPSLQDDLDGSVTEDSGDIAEAREITESLESPTSSKE